MAAQILYWFLMAFLFGAGIAVSGLLVLAVFAAVIWVVGFMYRPRGGRWYYW
ncbi:MAG TPA: hydrophobic protein [Candidatus Dormibacteraeota bacterium]